MYWRKIIQSGWREKEPVEYEGDESSIKLKMMTLRAFSEGLITEERALELCPECKEDLFFDQQMEADSMSATEFLKLSEEKRNEILESAIDKAAKGYYSDVDNLMIDEYDEGMFSEEAEESETE
jgi:hypothetical protein